MPWRKCKVDLSSRERWILQLGTNQSIQVNTLDLVMMMIQQKENEEKHSSSQLVSRHFQLTALTSYQLGFILRGSEVWHNLYNLSSVQVIRSSLGYSDVANQIYVSCTKLVTEP